MTLFNKLIIQKMIIRVKTIINSKYKTKQSLSLERFLYYLSKIYKIVVLSRSYLYKTGILKSRELPCFVISIGNIVAGGTGKTPMTIFLAKYLISLGYKVAIVTRGYKGEFEHKGGIVCDGEKNLCTPQEAGDESYMMAQLLKLPLLAGKNRLQSCKTAIKKFSCDIIILDDAFQHMALKRDLNLLLIDSKNPFGNRYLLPRGPLREPCSTALQRCDAIIYTHSSSNIPKDTTDVIFKNITTFKSTHISYINKQVSKKDILPSSKSQTTCDSNLKGKQILLFSGIAKNSNFKNSCENMGFTIKKQLEFDDHYEYTKKDIDRIKTTFKLEKVDFIVTTLKDYVKVSDCFSAKYPVMVLDVNIHFNTENRQNFEIFIKNRLKHKSLSCTEKLQRRYL